MFSFLHWLNESEEPFPKTTNHGWWEDNKHLILYHGTHKRNLDGVRKNGITNRDPTTGMVSMTLDPHTAHGYAAMSGAHGEARFRKADAKPVVTSHEDRVVTKFKIPMKWAKKHLDPNLRGNIGQASGRLKDKTAYEKWRQDNPGKSDHEYYATTEHRFSEPIPARFYVGHSFKSKK